MNCKGYVMMESEPQMHFDNLKITTMTLIFNLDCVIDLRTAFLLTPITKIENNETKTKYRTRYKIPHYKEGSILSMRYRGFTRGILKTLTKRYFKNSVTVDLSLKEKNVNVKMCASKFHMCGAKTMDQGYEGANIMLKNLEYISNIIKRMNENPEIKQKTLNTILSKIKKSGKLVWKMNPQNVEKDCEIPNSIFMKISNDIVSKMENLEKNPHVIEILVDEYYQKFLHSDSENMISDGQDLSLVQRKRESLHKWLSESLTLFESIEIEPLQTDEKNSIDMEYYTMILQDIDDKTAYDQMTLRIDIIRDIESVFTGNLSINGVNKAMVNFNYSLGCKIDRHMLKKLINEYDGFYAQFDNSIVHYVTIKCPYESPDVKKKKNKVKCHSFLVYKSGLVTQSGPNEDLMKEVYQKFMNIFSEIHDQVVMNDDE